jgi:hypothetical protein
MESVAIRVFSFSILPVIIAAGHLGLDRSSRSRERRLEIFLLYLFGVGVAGKRTWWILRSLFHFGLGRGVHRLADR